METSQKHYKALLDVYRAVYSSINVDFDTIDKEEGFYKNYVVPEEDQILIVNKVLFKMNFSKLEKRAIRSAYFAGVSPKNK